MNITIIAVGKNRTEHFESAIEEYQKRITRWVQVKWKILPASDPASESQQLLKIIDVAGPETVTILLDERGQEWSTPELAFRLAGWQNQAVKHVIFIIGGAHGVSEEIRKRTSLTWCLSQLVFPHELVRVLVIEQLYRAYDLNNGGKYHHV